MRDRTRETLTIEDVGNEAWDPLCFSNGPGIAYYFPALARLAVAAPTYECGWYGDQLLFRLTYGDAANGFLEVCDVRQRQVVGRLLERLQETFLGRKECLSSVDDFVEARALWSGP